VKKQVRLEVCDAPVDPGDFILNHVGFAIRRISRRKRRRRPWRCTTSCSDLRMSKT
jgi:hydrogenase maturation factor